LRFYASTVLAKRVRRSATLADEGSCSSAGRWRLPVRPSVSRVESADTAANQLPRCRFGSLLRCPDCCMPHIPNKLGKTEQAPGRRADAMLSEVRSARLGRQQSRPCSLRLSRRFSCCPIASILGRQLAPDVSLTKPPFVQSPPGSPYRRVPSDVSNSNLDEKIRNECSLPAQKTNALFD
jgi:hypothetical protein